MIARSTPWAVIVPAFCWFALFPLAPSGAARPVSGESLLAPQNQVLIQSAAEDSTGVIWGMSPESSNGQLYRWSDDHWVSVPGPGGSWRPFRLWTGHNGGVIAVWVSLRMRPNLRQANVAIADSAPFARSFLIAWRRGNKVRRIAQTDISLQTILPAPSGQILITGDGPRIDRVGADGKLQPVYTLHIEQFFLNGNFSFRPRPFYSFLQLNATQDGQGRTWIWSDAPDGNRFASMLQGFLVYDGKRFTYHRTIQGLPNGKLSYLGPWDSKRLVAAVMGDGLYLINTSALTARRIDDPESHAFRAVQKYYRAGGNRYVLASPGGGRVAANGLPEFTNNLWRLRNGRWKVILTGFDHMADARTGLRPSARARGGLWVGTIMRGLWFIPENRGKPRVIDWRQGFPFDTPRFLFAIPGNRLLAIEGFPQASTLVLRPARLLSAPAPPTGIRLLRTRFLLEPDSQHHFWGFVEGQAPGLDEWSGERWASHPLPPNLDVPWTGSLDADSHGRIWIFPGCRSGPSAFFNPRLGKWREFENFEWALEQQAGKSLTFQNPSQDPALPAFGPDGRIAFMGPCGAVHYFDGSGWRMFRRGEIVNVIGMNDGPPYFDKNGDLKMVIAGHTWEYAAGPRTFGPVPGGGWRRVAFDPGPVRHEVWFRPRPPGLTPPGCPFRNNSSLSRDRLGRYWWTWEGNLYEGVAGSCRLVLAAGEAQPFIDGRKLRRVLVSARGDVFLETRVMQSGQAEYVFLPRSDAVLQPASQGVRSQAGSAGP